MHGNRKPQDQLLALGAAPVPRDLASARVSSERLTPALQRPWVPASPGCGDSRRGTYGTREATSSGEGQRAQQGASPGDGAQPVPAARRPSHCAPGRSGLAVRGHSPE